MSRVRNHRYSVKCARLGLEALEERAVPATVVFSGGNLTISNPTYLVAGMTNIQVTETSPGLFAVTDGGHASGSYRVTGSITIDDSNRAGAIGVTLNDGGTPGAGDLMGSLTIYGGNSADAITVDGTSGTEAVRGNLYVDGGYGDDVINVGTTNGLTVRGSGTIIGNLGNDQATFGNTTNPSAVRGGLAIYSTQSTTLKNTTVSGATLDTLQMSPTNSATKFSSLTLSVNNGSMLKGQLTINAGSLTNSFTFDSTSTLSRTIINAPGNDTLDLASVVNGNFTFNGGNGSDTITIESTAAIHPFGMTDAGNLTLNLGNGSTTYNLGGTFDVDGAMTMTAANSDQTVPTFGGTVAGLLSISWGSGTNLFTLDNGSASAINYTLASGASNTLNIFNDSVHSNNITIIVPTTVGGSYGLNLNFGGGAPPGNGEDVTITGGTANPSGPSTGTITINWQFDPSRNVDTSTLHGDIVVNQVN